MATDNCPTVLLENKHISLHDVGDRQVCRNTLKADKVILKNELLKNIYIKCTALKRI